MFNRFVTCLYAGLVFVALSCAAWAQSPEGAPLDEAAYTEWQALASRAEGVTDRGQASTSALEILRADIAAWRTRFRDAQSANSSRITTLRDQITALGPLPEGEGTEPPAIAAQRADLEARLAEAETPGRRATAAFEQAGGLIREIDAIIAERQTTALRDSDPSILNPVHWVPTISGLLRYGQQLWGEIRDPLMADSISAVIQNNALPLGMYLVFAFVVLLRASRWLGQLTQVIGARFEQNEPFNRLVELFLGVARVGLQVLGLWAIGQAVLLVGIQGLRIAALIEILPWLGAVILGARWLGRQTFRATAQGPQPEEAPLAGFAPEPRATGRWFASFLGLVLALWLLLGVVRETGEQVADYWSILAFPLVVLGGLMLARLARLLIAHASAMTKATEEPLFAARALKTLARGLYLVAFAAPLLSLFGYANAADALIWPALISLALLAVIAIVQNAIHDIFALASGKHISTREALLPTLIGVVVGILSLPIFALIWGVRAATLHELWAAFLGGVSVGGAVISPANFMTFAIVFAALYMATRMIQGVLRTTVMPKTKLDSGGRNAIISGTGYVGVILAALIAITAAGIDLSGLAIVAGALSVGIGFGLQTIVSNFVSGIILLIERPIKIGDWIQVGTTSGYVRAISVRSTRIETFDRQDVIVPNADLIAGTVTNYTLGNTTGRVIIPVGVAYGTDTRRVESILQELSTQHPMIVTTPPPAVVLVAFGADSLDFEIRAILRDVNWMLAVKSELNHLIAARFLAEGIEIPFGQRDIWIRNPEALVPPAKPA